MENLYCLRCNRELEAGDKIGCGLYVRADGRDTTAPEIGGSADMFLPSVLVSLAMGPPPEGALDIAAWNMIRDLVGSDPALNHAAWESLRGITSLCRRPEPMAAIIERQAEDTSSSDSVEIKAVGGRATRRFVATSQLHPDCTRENAEWIPRRVAAHAGRRRVPRD